MKNKNSQFIENFLDNFFPLSKLEESKNYDIEKCWDLLGLALNRFEINMDCIKILHCAEGIPESENYNPFRIIAFLCGENDENEIKIKEFTNVYGFEFENMGANDVNGNPLFGVFLQPSKTTFFK